MRPLINRSKLPPSAFTCVECGAVAGECDHTDPKKNPGYKVLVCGIIEMTHQPMNELLVMGPVTPKPFPRVETSLLFKKQSFGSSMDDG